MFFVKNTGKYSFFLQEMNTLKNYLLVKLEVKNIGVEPMTSCMPCVLIFDVILNFAVCKFITIFMINSMLYKFYY